MSSRQISSTRSRFTKRLSSTGSMIFTCGKRSSRYCISSTTRPGLLPRHSPLVEAAVVAEAAAARAAAAGLHVHAAGLQRGVAVEVEQLVGQLDRDRIEVDEAGVWRARDLAVRRVGDAAHALERLAGRERVGERADDELALAADHDVDVRVRGGLLGQQRGVDAAPDDRHPRLGGAHPARELESVADLGPAHGSDPDEDGVADAQAVVVREAHVEDARPVAGAVQGARHVQQLKRHLRVRRAVAPREDEQDILVLGTCDTRRLLWGRGALPGDGATRPTTPRLYPNSRGHWHVAGVGHGLAWGANVTESRAGHD